MAARSQLADHLGPGLVRRVGQLDERDALVGMGFVPVRQERREVVREIARRDERQGTASLVLGSNARPGTDTETGVARQYDRPDQESSTRGTHPPHRFLPVHDPAASPTIVAYIYPLGMGDTRRAGRRDGRRRDLARCRVNR